MSSTAPPPINRPKLARYIWERSLKLATVGDELDCSYEQVRLICLPFDDPKRRVPTSELLSRIVEWTEGQVTAADFYPAHLNGHAAREPLEAAP